MPVGLSGARPLNVTTESVTFSLIAEPAVEDNGSKTLTFRVAQQNFTPPAFTASVTTTSGSADITGTDLSKVRVGDAIAGTGIAGTITAVSTAVTPHTATVSAAATASSTVTATFTPPTFNLALLDLVVTTMLDSTDNSTITATVDIRVFDGSDARDENGDARDNATGQLFKRQSATLPMDSIFLSARKPRA